MYSELCAICKEKLDAKCIECLANHEEGQCNVVNGKHTCDHEFHQHCMDRWLMHGNVCPLCNVPWKTDKFICFICSKIIYETHISCSRKHTFHKKCIHRHLKNFNFCPADREKWFHTNDQEATCGICHYPLSRKKMDITANVNCDHYFHSKCFQGFTHCSICGEMWEQL